MYGSFANTTIKLYTKVYKKLFSKKIKKRIVKRFYLCYYYIASLVMLNPNPKSIKGVFMYIRKTVDEWQILGNYGYGWDIVCCYSTYKEAKTDLKLYRENEGGYATFKLIKKRINKQDLK